jgi:hypothetical protein
MYFNVSLNISASTLPAAVFYQALYEEQQLWDAVFAAGATYHIPGTEGSRQVDTARGALVLSLSLYVGLNPNYGDGGDYWSPQTNRGGSLPFQTIAVNQNLLDLGLNDMAAARVGYWFDHYVCPQADCVPGAAPGSIDTASWKVSFLQCAEVSSLL